MNRKYLVEGNMMDLNSSLAADPRYFQECSSDRLRLVGQAEFSNSRVWFYSTETRKPRNLSHFLLNRG